MSKMVVFQNLRFFKLSMITERLLMIVINKISIFI